MTLQLPNVDHWGHIGGFVFGALTAAATVKQNGSQFRKMLRLIGATQLGFLGMLSILVLFTLDFDDCQSVVYLGRDKGFYRLGENCSGMCTF